MPGVVSHLLKKKRDDFATVKGRGMVSGLFEKKRDAIPPHPAPSQALKVGEGVMGSSWPAGMVIKAQGKTNDT
jgi:hypothetical protein